jgi:hypothetical protein
MQNMGVYRKNDSWEFWAKDGVMEGHNLPAVESSRIIAKEHSRELSAQDRNFPLKTELSLKMPKREIFDSVFFASKESIWSPDT